MVIDVKLRFPFIIVSMMTLSACAERYEVTQLDKSTLPLVSIRGDPKRIDVLTALVELTGGGDSNRMISASGHYQFAKAIGPFTSIDVKIDNNSKPLFAYLEPLAQRGMTTQAVSCVIKSEPGFETAVKRVRDVEIELARKARVYNFVECRDAETSFVAKTLSPAFGGWVAVISVRREPEDKYVYRLLLERNLKSRESRMRDVHLEVEL